MRGRERKRERKGAGKDDGEGEQIGMWMTCSQNPGHDSNRHPN